MRSTLLKYVFIATLIWPTIAGKAQTEYPLETVLQKGHGDYIRAAAIDETDGLVVTGSFDNVLILWDLNSGKQIRTFTGHTERIYAVEFSKDHQRILSCGADFSIREFDIFTGKQLHTFFAADREIHSAKYSVNGKYIYGLTNRDEVWVWNASTGEKIGIYHKSFSAHQERYIIHPEKDWILSAEDYKQSHLIDLISKDTIRSFSFDKAYSHHFSPDGSKIVIGSQKLFAKVFDTESGELLFELRYGEDRCDGCNTMVGFSPTGKEIITISNKGVLVVWDAKNGQQIKIIEDLPKSRPRQLLFSEDGSLLALSFGDEIHVYNTANGRLKWSRESDIIGYYDFAFSESGNFLSFPEEKGGLSIYNTRSFNKRKVLKGFLNQDDNDGLQLSYSNWIQQSILSYIQHRRGVKMSPDQRFALFGGVDTTAFVMDLITGRMKHRLIGHSKSVVAFDYSQDGKYIATGGGDRHIIIWDADSGRLIKRLKGHQETIFDLCFSADGKTILSGSWDGSIRLWDIEEGTFEYIKMDRNSPYRVGFSPDELYLVTGDLDRNFQFWERDAAEPFRTLIGHTDIPADFDFSPDGQEMVTCSWDGYLKEWNVLTGMLIGKMDKHEGGVYAVKYHPSENIVASGGADGQIILWDAVHNKPFAYMYGHSTSVTDLDFTADGNELISMSQDGVMKVWDWKSKSLLYTYVQLSQSDWLATTPTGYFDGSKEALQWVNYVKGTDVINIAQVFEKYYTPGLIQQVRTDPNSLNDRSENISNVMNRIPSANLYLYTEGVRAINLSADSIYRSEQAALSMEIAIPEHKQALSEMRIYNNGKLVLTESMEENVVFRGIGSKKTKVDLSLVPGVNEISVVLISEDRTESAPSEIKIAYDGLPAETELFLLSIGVNKYKNPAYELDYAVNDCKAFEEAILDGANDLFAHTHSFQLLNDKVTKPNILKTIEMIKDSVGPEDVFLFYYAGHGVMSQSSKSDEDEFYIVTHDVTNLYGSPKEVAERAISATELMQFSMEVSAEKQLFILDACHSGGAVKQFASRGSAREKTLAQLARSTGTFFITAAQDAEYANEVGKLKHGLFTYALLELLEGNVDSEGEKVTVNELKTYVEDRVPELSETYHGSPQYPTGYSFGRDFPIVILK